MEKKKKKKKKKKRMPSGPIFLQPDHLKGLVFLPYGSGHLNPTLPLNQEFVEKEGHHFIVFNLPKNKERVKQLEQLSGFVLFGFVLILGFLFRLSSVVNYFFLLCNMNMLDNPPVQK